ncbi:uncharacterized protein F5147DRAFT_780257 [Suillus discolor]|uniref:Uncharacterized protein n=1 Tax=Suillus discolor TaxID=1912936 RepID=A0A9P7EUW0_9AGAM|nr:uncharacterized protein F5147DRAFT_780257 [Suillus discolor]KAG2090606.1 hypothetical protein F5147DRAFT_780257 [Suillus discolor]
MFIHLSTAFVVLLGLTALVNAGVPAARHAAPIDKRGIIMTRANYLVPAPEKSPEPDPGKKPVVVTGREESPEPDPGKKPVH